MRGPGRKFEKGKSGNPGGLSKKKREVLAFQQLKYEEFIDRLQLYGQNNKQEIKNVIDNPNTQVFDLIFCRHLYDAMKGDSPSRESLYNRLWGKVKDQVEFSQSNKDHEELLNMIPVDELVAIIKRRENEKTAQSQAQTSNDKTSTS